MSTRSSPCSARRIRRKSRAQLRDVLTDEVSLGIAPDSLVRSVFLRPWRRGPREGEGAARGDDPDGDATTLDVLAALQKFPRPRPHPEAFVDALEALQPRLYSISSSPRSAPGKLSLTVDAVRYMIGKRRRIGVASTYLCERPLPATAPGLRAEGARFCVAGRPEPPIMMIGPGTGIAPFRAFLQERNAHGASGRNWLFYGHQHQATDFFYATSFRR